MDRQWSAGFSFALAGSDGTESGLRSLAGQFGVSLPTPTDGATFSPEFFADVASSRAVLEPIAAQAFELVSGDTVGLDELFDIDEDDAAVRIERTVEALKQVIDVSIARPTGVVSVRVTTPDPGVSYTVAKSVLDGLNDFNVRLRRDRAAQERRFSETRVREQRATLDSLESEVIRFLRTNREYESSAELMVQRDRLRREVELHQAVLVGLAQSLEEQRIREVRDVPLFSVVEQPRVPVLPVRRQAVLKIGFAVIAAVIGAWAVLVAYAELTLRAAAGSVVSSELLGLVRRFARAREAS